MLTTDLHAIQAHLKDTGKISDATMDRERGGNKERYLETAK